MKKSDQIDLFELPTVAELPQPENGFPLAAHSPRHSTTRKKKYFHLGKAGHMGPLANVMAHQFIVYIDDAKLSLKSADAFLVAIRSWMVAIADCAVLRGLDPREWDKPTWQVETDRWWLRLQSGETRSTTQNSYLSSVKVFIAHLQRRQILPTFKLPEPIEGAVSKPKATFGEITSKPADDVITDEEAAEAFQQISALQGLKTTEAVLTRINLLLSETRSIVETKIRLIWKGFVFAKRSIEDNPHFDCDAFLQEYRVSSSPLKFRRGWRQALTEERDLIKLISHMYNGIIPEEDPSNPLLKYIYNSFGVKNIRRKLHSTPETSVLFLALILIDKCLNVSSVHRMSATSFSETDVASEMKVTWVKGRSNYNEYSDIWSSGPGKALEIGSNHQIPALQALICLNEMRTPLIPYAPAEASDKLFLVWRSGDALDTVDVISEAALIGAWHRFRLSNDLTTRYKFTLDKLRPTLLLKEYIESGGNLFSVQAKALHRNVDTSQDYIDRNIIADFGNSNVRVVQDLLLLKAVPDRADVLDRLGLNEQRAKEITDKAADKGFGGWNTSETLDGEEQQDFTSPFIEWLTGREYWLLEDAEVAAEIFAFKAHIIREAPTLQGDASWNETWAPLLILLEIALREMRPDIRQRGAEIAESYQVSYAELT